MNRKLSGHIQSIGVLKIGFKHFERILERFSHGSYVHLPPRSLSISPQTFSRNNHKTKHTTTTINRSPHFKQENPNSPPQNPRFLSLQGVGLVRVLLFYLFLKAKPRAKIRTEVVWEPQSSPRVRRRVSRRRQKQLKFKKIIIIKASMGISTDPPNSAPDAVTPLSTLSLSISLSCLPLLYCPFGSFPSTQWWLPIPSFSFPLQLYIYSRNCPLLLSLLCFIPSEKIDL